MLSLWDSATGMMDVELTCAEIENAFYQIAQSAIAIYNIRRKDEITVLFRIHRKELKLLTRLCNKKGYRLRIVHKRGLYWLIPRFCKRPIIVAGLLFCLIMTVYLPTRVIFVCVDGNHRVPSNRIIHEAEKCGVRFGALRKSVRNEQIKNALLGAIQELKWVGINTQGCTAVISVQERANTKLQNGLNPAVCSIIAARDGVVTHCTATSGNMLCKEGDAVSKGQILISGYTDCGLSIQATHASGEITADTVRELTAIMPLCYDSKLLQNRSSKKYSLIIGKKRINLLFGSGIQSAGCGRMYKKYVLTLPGGFELPIALAVDSYESGKTTLMTLDEDTASTLLKEGASGYLSNCMVAGTILQKKEFCRRANDAIEISGKYICTEIIGTEFPEQIGDYHEQNR